jgi:hypothetical protein
MFKQDQTLIAKWCRNPDKLMLVGVMVLLSIRMQWVGVGNQMADVRKHGAKSKCLWGFKLAGYKYLRDNKAQLYRAVRDYRAGRTYLNDLLREFLKVPGLGLPKAGFLAQLVVGRAGCLDMHNVERFDLDARVWLIRPRKNAADQVREIDDKIALYLKLIDLCGGTEKLWDEWCEHVNDKVGTFDGAADVSRRHYIYLLDISGDSNE